MFIFCALESPEETVGSFGPLDTDPVIVGHNGCLTVSLDLAHLPRSHTDEQCDRVKPGYFRQLLHPRQIILFLQIHGLRIRENRVFRHHRVF
jgi:hypothetical protein